MDRDTQIIEMVRNGVTRAEAARKFRISAERVRQIVNPVLGKSSNMAMPVSDSEQRMILDLALRGLHVKGISEVVGRSQPAVKRICRRNAVVPHNGIDAFGAELRAKAVKLVSRGLTFDEAAERLGMTRGAVAGACWRHRQANREARKA